jgi:hypothetical protein
VLKRKYYGAEMTLLFVLSCFSWELYFLPQEKLVDSYPTSEAHRNLRR